MPVELNQQNQQFQVQTEQKPIQDKNQYYIQNPGAKVRDISLGCLGAFMFNLAVGGVIFLIGFVMTYFWNDPSSTLYSSGSTVFMILIYGVPAIAFIAQIVYGAILMTKQRKHLGTGVFVYIALNFVLAMIAFGGCLFLIVGLSTGSTIN